MPIAFRVVSDAEYAAWLADAKKKFSANPLPHYAEAGACARRGTRLWRRSNDNIKRNAGEETEMSTTATAT